MPPTVTAAVNVDATPTDITSRLSGGGRVTFQCVGGSGATVGIGSSTAGWAIRAYEAVTLNIGASATVYLWAAEGGRTAVVFGPAWG